MTAQGPGPWLAATPHGGDAGIEDMRAKLDSLGFSGEPNLYQLLSSAKNALENAEFLLRERQHDAAFRQYVEASEIALNVIPRHADYAVSSRNDVSWKSDFSNVLGRIRYLEPSMTSIKSTLSPVSPTNGQSAGSSSPPQPDGEVDATLTASEIEQLRRRPLPTPPSHQPTPPSAPITQKQPQRQSARPPPPPPPPHVPPPPPPPPEVPPPPPPHKAFSQLPTTSEASPEKRPQESPSVDVQKEDSGQAGPSADTDILALRFAELRKSHSRPGRTSEYFERLATSSPTANNTPSAVSPAPSPHVSDLKIPRQRPMSTSEYSDASSANSPTLQQQQPPIRPVGPRSMHSSPAPGAAFPQIPPKLPIPPSSLPRSPPSAYSPVVSSVPISAPRPPTALVDNSNRSYAYQSRSLWPGGTPDEMFISSGYQAYRPDGMSTPTQRPVRTPPQQSSVPHMTVLKPPSLVKYMKEHTVLLIDVREREIFDEGHIFSNNVICIEPIELQSNTSADELEERLIYSPPVEADLFARRNQFDLVVYYDQKTADASFLVGSPADCSRPHLRALHDSLYVFSRDKPLKDGRPPALLAGGLDAWIDYMGPQALTLTKTAAASGKEVSARKSLNAQNTIRRNPTINANSIWEVKKRRLHGYRALSYAESMKWAEKVRQEELRSISPDEAPPPPPVPEEAPAEEDTKGPGYVSSYDDFFRRFPEPQGIKQQSMVTPPHFPAGTSVHPPTLQGQPPAPLPPSRPPPAAPRTSYSGVSDSGRVQPPLARQAAASRTAVFAASSPIDRLPLPKTGLPNLGNTCYMNSILQCLSGTLPLTRYFVTDRFRELVIDQDQNFHGSHGILPGFYANLIRMLWRSDRDYRPLFTLREFCGRIHPDFRTTRQQDAKEFFDILVDALHEDFNQNWRARQLPELTEEEEARREKMPLQKVSNIEWGRYLHNESSLITYLFAGQHASRLECLTCHNTSTKCEAFYTISVEIPQSGVGHIYDCLNSYCAAERLEWKCKRCGDKTRESSKRIILTRAPQILVFHFKRFSTSWTGQTRKIHTPVNFPLTHLDMTPFMLNKKPPQPAGVNQGTQPGYQSPRAAPGSAANELATSPPYIYNAYAVVRHIGSSPTEGHYIALVRDKKTNIWQRYDDTRVTEFKPTTAGRDCVQNEQAYLVFYERVTI